MKVILLYHSLMSEKVSQRGYISPYRRLPLENFKRQMHWLSKFVDFVSLDEIIKGADDRGIKVAVTFDDGYFDNIELGKAIFETYKIPVTWFVCTSFVEDKHLLPWWDLLDFITENNNGILRLKITGETTIYKFQNDTDKNIFLNELSSFFFREPKEKQNVRNQLEDYIKNICSRYPTNAISRKNEVIEVANSPFIEIGAHTLNHINMSQCPEEILLREVQLSKEKLENWTGKKINWFAYPYGAKKHVNTLAKSVVRKNGFKGAVTTTKGYIDNSVDPFSIPRHTIPNVKNDIQSFMSVFTPNLFKKLLSVKNSVKIKSSEPKNYKT